MFSFINGPCNVSELFLLWDYKGNKPLQVARLEHSSAHLKSISLHLHQKLTTGWDEPFLTQYGILPVPRTWTGNTKCDHASRHLSRCSSFWPVTIKHRIKAAVPWESKDCTFLVPWRSTMHAGDTSHHFQAPQFSQEPSLRHGNLYEKHMQTF